MFTHHHNASTLALATAVAVVMGIAIGCHGQPTASADTPDTTSAPYTTVRNDHSLAAGDALGYRTLGATDGLGAMVLFRQSNNAIATAEAKVKDGTYEQWFASFNRDPDAIREAKADEPAGTNQTGTGIYVDVPIPEPVR